MVTLNGLFSVDAYMDVWIIKIEFQPCFFEIDEVYLELRIGKRKKGSHRLHV